MIKVYYRKGCTSSSRALNWLQKYKLPANKVLVSRIRREDVMEALRLSEGGVDDLLRFPRTAEELELSEMSLDACVRFLVSHTNLIRSPLLIEDEKLLIGFNEDQMRQFLPKAYRRERSHL